MATKSKSENGKIRNLAGATAFSMAVLSGSVYGLGLGSIELGSALNQPFSAEIEVLTDVPGEAAELAVQLASQEAFLRAGIDRPSSLNKLSFSLRERGGRSFIVVTSNDPIVEPFLNFLVEVDWKRGNLVREYTVLLDPPTFVSNTPSTTVSSQLAEVGDDVSNDATLPMRIEREAEANPDYTTTTLTEEELAAELAAVNLAMGDVPAAPSSNASEIIKATDPLLDELREVDDLMVVAANGGPVATETNSAPAAPVEVDNDIAVSPTLAEVDDNAVFAALDSVNEQAPAAESAAEDKAYTETAVDDMAAVVAALDLELADPKPVAAPKAPAPTVEAAAATGKTLDPVRRGQTLWSIASANRVSGVSVEQMMVALLRANPKAFEDGNINALNRGAIMRVPTANEVADMDSQSALTSVNEQNALWKKYRDQARAKPAEAQQGESAVDAPVAKVEVETPAVDGTLKLVADTDQAEAGEDKTVEANTAISAESEAQLATLRNQLNLAQEEADTERQRAEEMNSRVVDLESAVEKMNTLLQLRNTELAKLQAAVGAGQSEADAEAARQLAEAQEQMAQQLQQVKDEAQQQAEAAQAQRAVAEQEVANLQAKLEEASGAAAEQQTDAQQELADLRERLSEAETEAAAAEAASAEAAAKAEAEAVARTQAEASAAEASQAAAEAAEAAQAATAAEAEAKATAEAAKAATAAVKAEAEAAAKTAAEFAAAAVAKATAAEATAKSAEAEVAAQVEAAARVQAEAEAAAQAEATAEAEAAAQAEADAAAKAAEPWYTPYLTADNAKIAGGVAVAGLGLWALLGLGRKRKEEELFSEDSYVQPDDTAALATADYESEEVEEYDETEAGYDATAYGHTAIADELGDETVDATDLTALDATLTESATAAGNVDILQEADVYLSYGLADRAEELLDGAIASDPDDGMLQAKRLEALFVKQDGVSFETAALTYHDKFGGNDAPHWDKVASWGAALAPASNLFQGADPANLDETQDITSLDTTKLAGGAAAVAATAGGLAASVGGLAGSLGDSAEESVSDAIDKGADLREQAEDGLSLTSTELEDALDSTTGSVSSLGDDLSETAAESFDALDGLSADLGDDLSAELGGELDLSSDLSAGLDGDFAADLSGDLGSDLSAGLEGGLDDLDATAAALGDDLDMTSASLGDDLESMSAGLEDDLEMTDLEATLAGDGDLQDMLDATGADDFELSLADEGTGAGDGGLAGEISMGDLESELLSTDATGSLGGLSEEIDFEAAGLSLADETIDADLTVTGDEVDTMLDLARAYIDMGDADSANSTINEIIATGNADQVEAAKELQSQLG